MFDVIWLTLAVIVGLLHLGITTVMAQKYRPSDWGVGPRDTPMPSQGTAARMERAYRNFMETFPLFAAALLAVVVQSKSGGLSHVGAILYVTTSVQQTEQPDSDEDQPWQAQAGWPRPSLQAGRFRKPCWPSTRTYRAARHRSRRAEGRAPAWDRRRRQARRADEGNSGRGRRRP